MNIDLYYQLDDCVSICRRLIRDLDQDRDDFSLCAQGELRDVYRKNCDMIRDELAKFQTQLLILRDEQLL